MKTMISTAALLGLCVTTPALANDMHMSQKADRFFAKMDTDNDGRVTKAEHAAFADKCFREADTNGDNVISRDEMRAFKMREMRDYDSSRSTQSAKDKVYGTKK